MNSRTLMRVMFAFYMAVFFGFLFGPLLIMGVSSFNSSSYPQVYPFEGFTLTWFDKLLNDRDMVYGMKNSLWIGMWVVLLSVPLGLAGAMMMTQVYSKARSLYYVIVVSPVLTPGIIIGISTVVFWRDLTTTTGTKFLYDGVLLTVLGQSSFISAYCMLMFMSRLQRFDRAQEEAGLDLGASQTQVFYHILLPFLRPAIFSSAVLAFLSSFENYNTTTFAILADKTLTTVLAGRVRQGTTPAISALAVLIISVTICGAIIYELLKRREDRINQRRLDAAMAAERKEIELIETATLHA